MLPPTLISPEADAYVEGTSVELEWDAPAGVDYFTIWLFNLDTGEAVAGYDGSLVFVGTSHTVEGLSDNGEIYAWSVAASDGATWSGYAFPRLFVNGEESIAEATIEGTVAVTGAKAEIYTEELFETYTVVFRVDDGDGEPEELTEDQKARITTTVTDETDAGLTLTIDNAFPWLSGLKYFYIENEGQEAIVPEDTTVSKNGEEHAEFAGDNHGMAFNHYDGELHAGVVENGVDQYLTKGETTIEAGEKILAVMVSHAL